MPFVQYYWTVLILGPLRPSCWRSKSSHKLRHVFG